MAVVRRRGSPPQEPADTGASLDSLLQGTDAQPLGYVARHPSPGEPLDPFEELLVRRQLVSSAQLSEARLQVGPSGKRIGTLLVELGAVDDRVLARELAAELGLPTADLRADEPEASALQLVEESAARAANVIPLRLTADRLDLAVADPFDHAAIDAVATAANREVTLHVAPAADIVRAIQTSYRSLIDVGQLVAAFEAVDATRRAAVGAPTSTQDAGDAPVVRLVTQLLAQALRDRASDVHVEPQNDRIRVRFRIDGALHDVLALPPSIGPAVVSRLKIMASLNIAERRRSQDGQMALRIEGHDIDVRINTCPTVWGEKAVLRVLDRNRVLYRLEELGMTASTHEIFSRLVRAPLGMVICAGPTGSGKTTTLYASLAEVNQSDRNVTTIEDPVEYVFPSLTQIQINEQSGLTFASGLRAILRQDPDVILVGEIRDGETARIAIESALTGHLVLSSLHATDACAALQRLVDMGIEPFLVASTVTGMVSQRLFRRVCEQCRAPFEPKPEEAAFYREHAGGSAAPLTRTWRGAGCAHCAYTGYRDRVGVFELVRMTEQIKKLMVGHAPTEDLRAAAKADGSRSLLDEALALVASGATTIDEIMRNVYGNQI